MSVTQTLQVTSVWPGAIGGAIFKGQVVGQRKTITCKASYKVMNRPPAEGEFWEVTGQFIKHSDYGLQLQVSDCFLSHLPKANYVSSLLRSHPSFRGFHFGPKKIGRLMEKIGADALVDLLNNGKCVDLSDVLNPAIAEKLVSAWSVLKNEIDTINFLREHKFDAALSRKIIKLAKSNTVERLKTNPYALICFGSISRKSIWRTLESVARKMGIPKDDERRLIGAIEHVLYGRLSVGHTAITKHELIAEAQKVLKDNSLVESAIACALRHKAACVALSNDIELIQPVGPAYIEYSIESRIERLNSGPMQHSLFQSDAVQISLIVDRYANEFEREYGFLLTEQQLQAISLAFNHRCALISGYGGTGKTTVLRAITDIATSMNRTVYLMALSGKAKERMAQATGREAITVHGFIKAVKSDNDRVDIHGDPLIIIDEASMIDAALFNKLLALFDGLPFSLLTVGDTAQLSPVGFGVVWHRMALSQRIPKVHLTNVHRQAANSPIHHAAMTIRRAEPYVLPAWQEQASGIYLAEAELDKLMHTITQLKRLRPNAQVLTPHMSERMADSGHNINYVLQEHLNPHTSTNKTIRLGRTQLREGDPVIVTENCYDLGLFNGTTGKLVSVKSNSLGQLCGVFELDNSITLTELTVDQMFDVGIQLAYAISIHKSQGSEYEEVIICCATNSPLVERSLLYTAITRAKKLCVVVGSQQIFNAATCKAARADSLCVALSI